MPYKRSQASGAYVPQAKKVLDQVREVLRYHHYSIRTEEAYINWIMKYINFIQDTPLLMYRLIYITGLRNIELIRLRVHALDFLNE